MKGNILKTMRIYINSLLILLTTTGQIQCGGAIVDNSWPTRTTRRKRRKIEKHQKLCVKIAMISWSCNYMPKILNDATTLGQLILNFISFLPHNLKISNKPSISILLSFYDTIDEPTAKSEAAPLCTRYNKSEFTRAAQCKTVP